MADETIVAPAPTPESQAPTPLAPTAPAPPDPWAVDEAALAALHPDARASLNPLVESYKKRAAEEVERAKRSTEDTYKPYRERAEAMDKLVKYKPFVDWWTQQQIAARQGATPQQQNAISQTKPAEIATPDEWARAVVDASNGDPTSLQTLQARMMDRWASPMVNEITQKQHQLETQLEMKDLFERHPDAKDLDKIGMTGADGTSLLEAAMYFAVDKNGGTLEQGYTLAKQWAETLKTGAKQEAMGLVQAKKDAVTAGPSTTTTNESVVYVESADELIKKSLEATMAGQKGIRFVIKPNGK